MARDSGFKIQKEKYENAFQKRVPDFRKSKCVHNSPIIYKAFVSYKN